MFMLIGYISGTSYFYAEKSLKSINNWILYAACGKNTFGVCAVEFEEILGFECNFFVKFFFLL